MRALSAAELLDVWERGLAQSPAQRALTLLALATDEAPLERVAQWTIGERDARLLTLREQTFGVNLASLTSCPGCAEQLEFHIDAAQLRSQPTSPPEASLQLAEGDYAVEFRLPNSLDLANLEPAADLEVNCQRLLQRCVLSARRKDAAIPVAELPGEVVTAIARRMSEADPRAEMQLALTCPACHHGWEAPLDIVSYFWSEIHGWATRLMREIHSLATAYGWREIDILSLSPWRRQAYLDLIES
jgi:hypothetical protein